MLIQQPQAVLSGGKPSQGVVVVLRVSVDETWNSRIPQAKRAQRIPRGTQITNYQINTWPQVF